MVRRGILCVTVANFEASSCLGGHKKLYSAIRNWPSSAWKNDNDDDDEDDDEHDQDDDDHDDDHDNCDDDE